MFSKNDFYHSMQVRGNYTAVTSTWFWNFVRAVTDVCSESVSTATTIFAVLSGIPVGTPIGTALVILGIKAVFELRKTQADKDRFVSENQGKQDDEVQIQNLRQEAVLYVLVANPLIVICLVRLCAKR